MLLWENIVSAVYVMEKRLKVPSLTSEEKELELYKLNSIAEIVYYVYHFLFWHKTSEKLVEQYNMWRSKGRTFQVKNKMSKLEEQSMISNFNNLMEQRVGKDTIDFILKSTSIEAVQTVVGKFRRSTRIRKLKAYLLVDMLYHCLDESVAGTPEQKYLDYLSVRDRKKRDFGNLDQEKISLLGGVIDHADLMFSRTRDGFFLFYNGQIKFEEFLVAIIEDLIGLRDEQNDTELEPISILEQF
ncbi:hypothetical protein [uncultured Brevibacillus sp.]|uniref:hypothetical protein n=1 Tax=uncultured Brevibacillus sp. TaxID=169970 RepID=UPI00259A5CDD|nr:hypothetical protein [uncultured Brevibacillus sp.]